MCGIPIMKYEPSALWGNFLSLYSQFYEVTILENTCATNKEKMQCVFLDVKLRL
jgi:hypothetical protein